MDKKKWRTLIKQEIEKMGEKMVEKWYGGRPRSLLQNKSLEIDKFDEWLKFTD